MVIWKLNMPLRRKIGLGLLMALSLITAAASIMKTITTPRSDTGNSEDAQYHASVAVLWSGVEQSLVIIMGSIPPLRAKVKAIMVEHFGLFGSTVVGLVSGEKTTTKNRASKRFSGGSQQSLKRGVHSMYGAYRDMGDWDPNATSGYHGPELSSSGSSGSESPPMDQSMAEMGQIRRTHVVTITYMDRPEV